MSSDPMTSPAAGTNRKRRWEYPALIALGCAVVVILGLTVVLTDAPGSSQQSAAEADVARVSEVQALLDSWARAQMSDDPTSLAQFVDAAAAPGLLDAEIRRATAAGALSFSDWAYEVSPGTLVEAARTGSPDGVTLWGAQVNLRYALDGVDAAPTRKTVLMTFAERDGSWFVFADGSIVDVLGSGSTGSQLSVDSWHGPWDFGPLAVSTNAAEDSIVVGHPGQQAFVDALAADLDGAVKNTTQLWGDGWSERAVVMVAGSPEEFTAMVGSQHDGSSIAAVSVADTVRDGASDVSGQRIIFSPAAASRLTSTTRQAVLRHEMMHIAARSQTRDGSPMWVLEGYAEYAGNRGSGRAAREIAPTLAAAVRSGDVPSEFPEDSQFGGVPVVSSLAYESAWSINAYIADRFGESELTELFRALAVGPSTPEEINRRIVDVLGVSIDDLRDGWVDWLHRTLG
ncbi:MULTISPECIES: hypothetical protein [unclassified Rhodococcus (in: high G+C Gram-positive bacteria)]|uniref:hypothetical protein n=1 Tax=unclassified Rhodococcus (in: high G+C Gram-positive bacteria) TaxID=192944 RepID=UPI001EF9DE60|nr:MULTISPECIES: hypothetical protein [unclassified Rhodococcus (in: high G+C Gram-positive bacteria)]